jgi:hypothetical protein
MKYLRLFALGAFAGVALLLWLQVRSSATQSQEIASLESWEKGARLRLSHALTRQSTTREAAVSLRGRYRAFHADTLYLPGKPDTVCVPIALIATADSTINADSTDQTASDTVVAIAVPLADSADRRADLEKKRAKGPWIRSYAELLFSGSHPRAAAQLEAGRRLSAVARLEIDTLPRIWAGLRYQF